MNKLILTMMLTLAPFCYSNDGGYGLTGDTLHPIDIVDISMDYERLIISQSGNIFTVIAYIELFNHRDNTIEPLIGFELAEETHNDFVPYTIDSFNDLVLMVNGMPQEFEYKENEDTIGRPVMHMLLYKPKIKPGLNIIYHHYSLKGGFGSLVGRFQYILTSGARWMDGLIKDIEIIIKSDTIGMLRMDHNSFSEFDIVGEGKKFDGYFSLDDDHYSVNYSLNGGYLYKHLVNYRPVQNISLCYEGFASNGNLQSNYYPEALISHVYTSGIPPAPFMTYKYVVCWKTALENEPWQGPPEGSAYAYEKTASEMSKKDLRLLRNTIYAMHGYVFKDKEMQEYFEKQYWYYPRPLLGGNDIILDNLEKTILQKIIELENK